MENVQEPEELALLAEYARLTGDYHQPPTMLRSGGVGGGVPVALDPATKLALLRLVVETARKAHGRGVLEAMIGNKNLRTKHVRYDLIYDERATWGECPACKAPHGKPCDPYVGFSLGMTIDGGRPMEGAHMGRLQAAPFAVELRPIAAIRSEFAAEVARLGGPPVVDEEC